jgi:hypothetical protein
MPLCHVQASRYYPDRLQSYGYFVVDSPYSTQSEVQASLTAEDKKQIGYRLGMMPYRSALPAQTEFTLSICAANPLDLPIEPAFTTEARNKVWIFREEREIAL